MHTGGYEEKKVFFYRKQITGSVQIVRYSARQQRDFNLKLLISNMKKNLLKKTVKQNFQKM